MVFLINLASLSKFHPLAILVSLYHTVCIVDSKSLIDAEHNEEIAAAITEELVKELGVHPDNGYFGFYDNLPVNIGWKKSTFQQYLDDQK